MELYKTVIPDRNPREKVHLDIGHAKAALRYRLQWHEARWGMEMYSLVNGEWKLLYKINEGDNQLPWGGDGD